MLFKTKALVLYLTCLGAILGVANIAESQNNITLFLVKGHVVYESHLEKRNTHWTILSRHILSRISDRSLMTYSANSELWKLAKKAMSFDSNRNYLVCQMPTADKESPCIQVVDIHSRATVAYFPNSSEASISEFGARLAFIQTAKDDDNRVRVVNLKTGKEIFHIDHWPNPDRVHLSPSGRYFSVQCQLSRPVMGDTLFDLSNGKDITDRFDAPGYLPPLLDDWSSDERYIAWEWRVVDPNNNGSWKQGHIEVTSTNGVHKYRLGAGETARFAPNQTDVFLLREVHSEKELFVTNLKGSHEQLIDRNVEAFDVAQR